MSRSNAVGIQTLTNYVISGAGGFVGAGASVDVWSIGQTLQTNYSDSSGNSANSLTNSKGNPDSNAADQSQTGTGTWVAHRQQRAGQPELQRRAARPAARGASTARPAAAEQLDQQRIADIVLDPGDAGQAPAEPGTSALMQAGADIIASATSAWNATSTRPSNRCWARLR